MSEILEAIVLGIIQGLTEFLPVSSSGHIEIAKVLLNDDSIASQGLFTTVLLHFATALATILVFRKDILSIIKNLFSKSGSKDRNFALFIVISMVPAVIIGLSFEHLIELLFARNLLLVAIMLLFTGILLLIADKAYDNNKDISMVSAFVIGIAQAIAILPGISRSGATISTALLMGVEREKAARFSFLMVVPLIFGKIAKDLLDGSFFTEMPSISYSVAGFLAAFFAGIFACQWMISIVKKAGLKYFAYYCFVVVILLLIYYFV